MAGKLEPMAQEEGIRRLLALADKSGLLYIPLESAIRDPWALYATRDCVTLGYITFLDLWDVDIKVYKGTCRVFRISEPGRVRAAVLEAVKAKAEGKKPS